MRWLDLPAAISRSTSSSRPVDQREGLTRAVLREQHPCQHQIFPLLRVARLVVGAEAALLRPAGGRGGVTPGEQQPRPLRGYGAGQADHGRAGRDPLGLADRVEGPSRIAGGPPYPRPPGPTGPPRLGVPGPHSPSPSLLGPGDAIAATPSESPRKDASQA